MNENVTDSLLEELKNLNKDLTDELKKREDDQPTTIQPTISASPATVSAVPVVVTPPFVLTEDNLSEFILQNAQKIIQDGIKTIRDLQPVVGATYDSKLLESYASVVNATTGSIDVLNKINIEKHKIKASKEIKTMDIEAKKMITQQKATNNTVNIIATREEIMKILNDASEKITEKAAIDVDSQILPDPA
jgi:hypothetical protein